MRILLALSLGFGLAIAAMTSPAAAEKKKTETLRSSIEKKKADTENNTIRNMSRRAPSQSKAAATGTQPSSSMSK